MEILTAWIILSMITWQLLTVTIIIFSFTYLEDKFSKSFTISMLIFQGCYSYLFTVARVQS